MVWAQAQQCLMNGDRYWLNLEEIKQLNEVNDIYRQVTPEEEWLIKLYQPCIPEDPKAKFLMASEILARLNIHSQMKLSIKKLSQALEHQKFGEPISKRVGGKGEPRKCYAVIERDDKDEQLAQDQFSREHEKKAEQTVAGPF